VVLVKVVQFVVQEDRRPHELWGRQRHIAERPRPIQLQNSTPNRLSSKALLLIFRLQLFIAEGPGKITCNTHTQVSEASAGYLVKIGCSVLIGGSRDADIIIPL
jgi:hypothetical protein